ncbi:hypothetical protein L211DRAFT_841537 [Terfezia boudieri ATCC MYA-4762]|uniref:UBC core domain-containing protein n=1 Tax=Terfezia boudieri ATCC MYA-4762 TaxID=1051890 RepID=A0A3N4LRJ0_9PEZI|nr:hypothetical protein L211DRAFT_841537 [Terfezia boudieri ATCC MYA-4762]
MPRKQYLQHLTEVSHKPPDKNIESVRRGEDDGSFIISYKPPTSSGLEGHIEITGLIPDLADYPSDHQTYLYTSSSEVPAYITDALNTVEGHGLSLFQLIQLIVMSLNKVVLQKHGSRKAMKPGYTTEYEDEDTFMPDFEDEDDLMEEEEDNDSIGGWSDDGAAHLDEVDHEDAQMNDALNDNNRPEILPDLRRDLREAKSAGFRVGVLGDIKGGIDCYISLSIKISKLGLSDEAVNAWKLDKNRYLILLIHFNHYYKPLAILLRHSYHAKQSVQFCVGMSKHYKPTHTEAISAFSKVQPMQNENVYDEGSKAADEGFRGIFISRPLNELLNSRLIDLVIQRVEYTLSWDGSERFLADWQGKQPQHIPNLENYRTTEDTPANLPAIVVLDSLADVSSPTAASFPLIAMQYTLRHLVRCTEFCLVCHNKINNSFEALKPYVCSNPLCLYQYMALGFGPSIEYEIISQPTVVDLLISFCYASAKSNSLTDFPNGMNLLVPRRDSIDPDPLNFQAELDRSELPHTLSCTYGITSPLKRGEWIRVRNPQAVDTYYYRVEDTSCFPKITLSMPVVKPISTPMDAVGAQPVTPQGAPDEGCEQVTCTTFSVNFDEMDYGAKQTAITEIIDTIPPVYDMKTWLEENTTIASQASLRNWTDRISPAAFGVLRWIIASNRSCIIPVDEVDKEGNKAEDTRESRVWGMGDYIQFRFAMGAPDKEQRFVKAVKEAQQKHALKYPTLFAFHGSPLANWHSIVREGLHFKKTSHGRAFGHGCYHSLHLSTSLHYSSQLGKSNQVHLVWPNSCLKVNQAFCLNEIINAPSEFVSTTPHLVVAQLDWIQTRYLFVTMQKEFPPKPSPHGAAQATPKEAKFQKKADYEFKVIPVPNLIFDQDPLMTPLNTKSEKLIIPAAITTRFNESGKAPERTQVAPALAPGPTSTGKLFKVRRSKVSKALGSKSNVNTPDGDYDSDATVQTENEDLLILLSDDEGATKNAGTTIFSRAANLFGIGSSKKKETTPLTDFVPGSLDMLDIPLIPPPSYASSTATRRLQGELKAVLRTQESTPPHELGWYINPDSVTNVYQWIFEFHSFDENLPLAQDMKSLGLKSIILEARFGSSFPMSPPFIRVIKPRFLGFQQGGGGHVTLGGALCMELLTNSGWSAVSSLESVLLQVRMAMTSTEPRPARLVLGRGIQTYGAGEAKEAYIRACKLHGWEVPADFAAF